VTVWNEPRLRASRVKARLDGGVFAYKAGPGGPPYAAYRAYLRSCGYDGCGRARLRSLAVDFFSKHPGCWASITVRRISDGEMVIRMLRWGPNVGFGLRAPTPTELRDARGRVLRFLGRRAS
jgi:hypothetical protein